ncbi:MAG: hypothetical protein L0221_14220, partial [Chloroflexi bacterium]|nr:hypothetical protein [Chloroflexota bacterium]
MISDVLAEAVAELDHYLDSDDWRGFYGLDDDPLVRRLRRLRDEAEDLRVYLDTPPDGLPTERDRLVASEQGRSWLRKVLR